MLELIEKIKAHGSLDVDDIRSAGKHGADSGYGGFTYTKDAAQFYQENKELIWELLVESAEDQGMNVPTMIGSFGRVDMAETPDGFENLLAWFALEEAGRWLEDHPDIKAEKTEEV